jgi:hypothetical protein
MERRQFVQSMGLGAAATVLGVAPLATATTQLSILKEGHVRTNPPLRAAHV